jgi:hypothetical protein
VFDFEKNVIQLFKTHNIDFKFNIAEHYLISDPVVIIFIPNCSLPAFVPKDSILAKAIRSIRLWEDDYLHHKQVIDSRILSLIGISSRIYGRETITKAISQADLKKFLIANHLNVPIVAKHRYGLFNNQELVAVAAFGRSCPIQDNGITYKSHELIRYCSLLNSTVVGGLSKLISHFEQDIRPEHIMTYVDREWSDGSSYKKLGFKVVARTAPQIFWLSPQKYERLSAKHLSPDKSESQLRSEDWTSIKNLGNIKLVKYLK